eukprot:6850777-Pyramimonas_sp.AAC.1
MGVQCGPVARGARARRGAIAGGPKAGLRPDLEVGALRKAALVAMQCNAMQCNAMLRFAMLCYDMRCCAMLCSAMLSYAMSCCAVLC